MERSEIHSQIKEMADKITHLNDNLTASRKIHPVELDLLGLYCRELVKLIEELPKAATQASPELPKTNAVGFKPVEVNIPEVAEKPAEPEERTVQSEAKKPEPVVEHPRPQPPVRTEPVAEQPRPQPPVRTEPITEAPKDVRKVVQSMDEQVQEPLIRPAQPPRPAQVQQRNTEPEPQPLQPPMPNPERPVQPETPQPAPARPEPILPPAPDPMPQIPEPMREIPEPAPAQPEPATAPERSEIEAPSVYEAPRPRKEISFTAPARSQERADEPATLNDRFAPQDELLSRLKKPTDTKKMREMMDLGERFMFVKELFGADADLFDRSLKHIDQCKDLAEAEAFLEKEIKPRNGWEDKEMFEQHFHKLLEAKFEG
jgi:hypothetical protein